MATTLRARRLSLAVLAVGLLACTPEPKYPLVLRGGRVMDPATGVDTIQDIAIADGRIVAISAAPLQGDSILDLTGLVVAPGFIDLHAHGQTTSDLALRAQDGVTTALEMEVGVYPVASWYASMEGQSPINYGAAVGHITARLAEFDGVEIGHQGTNTGAVFAIGPRPRGFNEAATPAQITSLATRLQRGLDEGALGVGFGINYTPAATTEEIADMFRVAAARKATAFVHTRAFGLGAIREAIGTARETGTSLHIVHIGSSGGSEIGAALALIDSSRAAGQDVTTEIYPYTAASTMINSAMFNEGWQENLKISYGDLAWPSTGERLTAESFAKYRAEGGAVIIHMMQDRYVELGLARPDVMIGSDGMPFVNGSAHPRGAGSSARVLGLYTREKQLMTLMEALAKLTILPARRLEAYVPQMRQKGRIAVGADADLTIFDPSTVRDLATFEKPMVASTGIPYVMVNGEFVVYRGTPVDGARPGRAVRVAP